MLRTQDKRLWLGSGLEWVGRARETIQYDFALGFLAAPAGTNTKASWTDLDASTAIDCDGFWMTVVGAGSALDDHLIDIGLGGTGNAVDSTIISNFLFSGATTFGAGVRVYVPLSIPAGTRVAWRHQSSDANQGITMHLQYCAGGRYRAMTCRQATTYGANTADSGGTSIDPGGSASTKGAYVNLGAIATAHTYVVICIGTQNNATRTQADHFFDIACGTNIYYPDIYAIQSAQVDVFLPGVAAGEVNRMEVGANLQVRQSSSITDATDRLADVVVIGFD